MSSFLEDLKKQSQEEKDYTSLDGISTTRRIQFGARQEPTIAGNTYRLLKAGVQAAFSNPRSFFRRSWDSSRSHSKGFQNRQGR